MMKTLLKSKFVLVALVLFALSEMTAVAQPSIPRYRERGRGYYDRPPRHREGGVAWGTQYDWLSTRRATYSDIDGMDRGQIRVLLNSIYARHGRYFRDRRLSDYFYSQHWYRPYRNEVPRGSFNRTERYNIDFLSKYD